MANNAALAGDALPLSGMRNSPVTLQGSWPFVGGDIFCSSKERPAALGTVQDNSVTTAVNKRSAKWRRPVGRNTGA